MSKSGNKNRNKKSKELLEQAKIGNKLPGRAISEELEIEQTRIENRREADLEDKTPAGDAGVEDNKNVRQANDPFGESNY
jgi:hypothetical protein